MAGKDKTLVGQSPILTTPSLTVTLPLPSLDGAARVPVSGATLREGHCRGDLDDPFTGREITRLPVNCHGMVGEVPLARQPIGQLRPGLLRRPGVVSLAFGRPAARNRKGEKLTTIPSGVLAIVAGKGGASMSQISILTTPSLTVTLPLPHGTRSPEYS